MPDIEPLLPSKSTLIREVVRSCSQENLEELLLENPNLYGYLQGYLAEMHLAAQLRLLPGITSVKKIPDHSQRRGDLSILFNGREITLELKSLKTSTVEKTSFGWKGSVGCKNTDNREVEVEGKGFKCCNLEPEGFDILAICTLAATGSWTFKFMRNSDIPRSKIHPSLLSTVIPVKSNDTYLKDTILELIQ